MKIWFVSVCMAASWVEGAPPGPWKNSPPLKATHFWDCSGGGCDAGTLQPWDKAKYRYSPMYAPLNPTDHGGSVYGEKMWMTGAANDYLSGLMGPDAACCGADSNDGGVGGCGKCLLLKNPTAVNADWTVLVMKKNRCPPESNGCGPGNAHFDLAVPGFDNLQYSTANTCGDANTYITKDQSDTCGSWYTGASDTTKSTCCDGLPEATNEQKIMKAGCRLFASWGWKTGDPGGLEYQAVPCPPKFEQIIGGAFTKNGVTPVQPMAPAAPTAPTSTGTPPAPAPTTSTGGCAGGCKIGNCGCGWATAATCGQNDGSRCNIECCCRFRCPAPVPPSAATGTAAPTTKGSVPTATPTTGGSAAPTTKGSVPTATTPTTGGSTAPTTAAPTTKGSVPTATTPTGGLAVSGASSVLGLGVLTYALLLLNV